MIFIDSTVWIGAADRSDKWHRSAKRTIEKLPAGPLAITTDHVIGETVTILGRRAQVSAEQAKKVASDILNSPKVEVIFIDEFLLHDALEKYPQYGGKLSLTDVVSITVMEKYKIREIYSHDTDFDGAKGVVRKTD
ncbi:MAG: PIN domain-containing protein [Candidatus Hydrothermarchaeales archaeon]